METKTISTFFLKILPAQIELNNDYLSTAIEAWFQARMDSINTDAKGKHRTIQLANLKNAIEEATIKKLDLERQKQLLIRHHYAFEEIEDDHEILLRPLANEAFDKADQVTKEKYKPLFELGNFD